MNSLDYAILSYCNEYLGNSPTLDAVLYELSDNVLLQGFVPATAIWYLWFRPAGQDQQHRSRECILAVSLVAIALLLVARGLALALPFRARPFSDPNLAFQTLYPQWGGHLYTWSSFPSDHAVLFFALACGLWSISRPIGALLFIHALVVDCLPRIYLGYHFPTDVLAGALLGGVGMSCLVGTVLVKRIANGLLSWSQQQLGWFYAGLTLFTLQLATMFESILHLSKVAFYLGRSAYRHIV